MPNADAADFPQEPRPRLILADDHPLIIEALGVLLRPDFEVVCAVEDGEALVAAVAKCEVDLVITDLSMPMLDGLQAIARIRQRRPGLPVIVLSMHGEPSYAREVFASGANGFVVKTEASEELLTAIRTVLRGGTYVSSSLSELRAALSNGMSVAPAVPELSRRQQEILQLLAEGLTAKQIARQLHISTKTVEYHRTRLLELLNLKTTAELIRYSVRAGLA